MCQCLMTLHDDVTRCQTNGGKLCLDGEMEEALRLNMLQCVKIKRVPVISLAGRAG